MKNLTLVMLLVILIFTSCGHSTPNDSDAKEAARAAIIHSLKDPLSADFYHNETIKNLGNNKYIYTETVGATNSFGGKIAQDVSVKVEWNGGDPSKVENWKYSELLFTER